jgi:lipoprotein NlpI
MRTFVAAALAGAMLVAAGSDPRFAGAQEKKDEKKDEKLMKLLDEIEAAAKARKYDDVIKLANEAAKLDPDNPGVHFAIGSAYAAQRKNQEAANAFTKVIELAKDASVAYDRRGDANLKLGKFKDAVKDFDAYLAKVKDDQRKEAKAHHWRRGIALYYAGQYKEGAEQFEVHKTVNAEDVENAVWHYLCNVRATKNKEKAQKDLIPIKDDTRVPMKKIHEMFAGKCQPAEVIAEVAKLKLTGEALKEAEFYGHLYVALYYDSEDKKEECQRHLTEAVEKHKISHYMWDVGAAHLEMLKKKK